MKKYLFFTLTLALILGLSACGAKEEEPFEKGEKLASVFVATDTHLLSNELFSPDNQKYVKKAMTADGRVQEHDYLLMEALVEEVNREKPDALIITGDLTFYGVQEVKKKRHSTSLNLLLDTLETWEYKGSAVPLADVLHPLTETIRSRMRARQKIAADLQTQKSTLYIITASPFVFMIAMRLFFPDSREAYQTLLGTSTRSEGLGEPPRWM